MPDRPVAFVDGVFGSQTFPPGAGGDFVILRSDGIIGYQLAVVVDDAEMAVTDVLRGADLLDSTPRQIQLYHALGWQPPHYAHVPLLYGPDGGRLSKRHGSVNIVSMRSAGLFPEQLIGWMCYGSGLTDRMEPLKAVDAIPLFDLQRIPKHPVRLDEPTLRRLAGE